jgi:hypothetical protein
MRVSATWSGSGGGWCGSRIGGYTKFTAVAVYGVQQ